MEAAALKAAHGKQNFKIVMPSNVIMIHADEEPTQLAQAVGDEIIVDIDTMNANAERRKNKWRSD
jgi:putative transposase